jgi:two-component system phosphate regulon sensor histidine kinase PhoR
MKRTMFLKVFGGFLLVILAFTFLLLLFSVSTIKNFYLDTLAFSLEKLGQTLKLQVIPYLGNNTPEELDAFVKNFGDEIDTRITIIDREGLVLADSDEDPKSMNNHKFRPEIAMAYQGQTGRSLRFSNTVGADMLYLGLPIKRNGEISEVIRVSLYIKDIDLLYSGLRTNMWRIIIILSLFSLGVAFFFCRTLSQPIKKMKFVADKIASGDFSSRVYVKNRDELKGLADGMNSMAEHLQTQFDEISRQKEELNRILSSIADGLIAVDKQGKILFCNDIFKEIFETGDAEGKFYWETIRDRSFNDFIKDVQEEKRSKVKEIEREDRLFQCQAILLSSRQEIVITLHDLTEIRRLEKIKKDFISNVSHELRTPLTAIKGFTETLSDEVDGKCQSYVDVIDRHTNRLIYIVKDLLLLSQLEEGETKLDLEKVDLSKLIKSILTIFDQEIKKKGLTLHLDIDSGFPIIKADAFKLEQMFINIFDNAVKYTDKGKIEIFLKRIDKDSVSISIKDTGLGIPKEHLPRVFERFYVVDKSRSRTLGGTGLGLSIVKHISLLHKGNVSVESTLGEGTSFTIILPLNP